MSNECKLHGRTSGWTCYLNGNTMYHFRGVEWMKTAIAIADNEGGLAHYNSVNLDSKEAVNPIDSFMDLVLNSREIKKEREVESIEVSDLIKIAETFGYKNK